VVLKALIDINMPKFLHNDILLFDNIVKDLFPSTKRPESKLATLQRAVDQSLKEMNLTSIPSFVEKVYQF
jgi:dynein heavy chain, axonemal